MKRVICFGDYSCPRIVQVNVTCRILEATVVTKTYYTMFHFHYWYILIIQIIQWGWQIILSFLRSKCNAIKNEFQIISFGHQSATMAFSSGPSVSLKCTIHMFFYFTGQDQSELRREAWKHPWKHWAIWVILIVRLPVHHMLIIPSLRHHCQWQPCIVLSL